MPESEDWPQGRPERRAGAPRSGSAAAAARIQQQQTWVDQQVQQAIRRGDFDDLPGAGKPLKDLGVEHDPDWWIKKLVERERLVVLPASVQLRKDDAALDGLLDEMSREDDVRTAVEEFNARVLRARYSIPEGPPLVTMTRDVEGTVAAWRERRAARGPIGEPEADERPRRRLLSRLVRRRDREKSVIRDEV